MRKIELKNLKNCFLVGIKGVGMTALAEILKNIGKKVTGSDIDEVFFTDKILKKLKIPYYQGFNESHISIETEIIIYSTAYNPKIHPELVKAQKLKIPIISYPEAVSQLFNQSVGIAVCGTHGKTTTSAILSVALKSIGLDLTALIGSEVNNWGTSSISGKSPLFVIEADEHQDKLRFYDPCGIIITNIDYDHPDFYPSKEDYYASFFRFIKKWKKKKTTFPKILVLNGDDKNTLKLIDKLNLTKIQKGLIGLISLKNGEKLKREKNKMAFDIGIISPEMPFKNNNYLSVSFSTKLIGKHNQYNFASAGTFLAILLLSSRNSHANKLFPKKVLKWLTKTPKTQKEQDELFSRIGKLVSQSLAKFKGTKRRLEFKGTIKNIDVYDDYAHHPEEIRSTLSAIKEENPKKDLFVIFHPHTFTRTKTFLNDFAKSLEIADKIGILEIYGSAREKSGEVSSKDIINLISKKKEVYYFDSHEKALKLLNNYSFKKPSILITMGAGDVWRVGEEWLKLVKNK